MLEVINYGDKVEISNDSGSLFFAAEDVSTLVSELLGHSYELFGYWQPTTHIVWECPGHGSYLPLFRQVSVSSGKGEE